MIAIVVIRDTQAIASAIGNRCSGGLPTGVTQSVVYTPLDAITRLIKTCYEIDCVLAKPLDFADWVASMTSYGQRGLATEVAQSNAPAMGVNDHLTSFVFFFTKS